MKKILLTLFILFPIAGFCQTITDGLLMPKNDFCTGLIYTNDRWTNYWEGELKRDNQNIGTLTTQSLMWVGNYGVHEKINIIAMLPYVKVEANKGTLHNMKGLQDLTLAVKYNFFKKDFQSSVFNTFAVLSYATPVGDYTPDYFPLSLGTATQNVGWRLTANYTLNQGFYINASGAYTWRSNSTIDRSAYYNNGHLYMTNEVKMPNVFDYIVSIGYHKNSLQAEAYYMQQNTLGGADIRRQDMPFVSNRMNFSKVGAVVMYYLPQLKDLAIRAGGSLTVAGRNVGESTTFMGGLLYTFHFSKTSK